MPYCSPNCHLLSSPAGAADPKNKESNQQIQHIQHICQNCPNHVTLSNHSVCRNCAQPGSVAYVYHHQHCGGISPL